MKFYIAVALTELEKVQAMYEIIISKWHEISVDWTGEVVPRPFTENSQLAQDFAIRDVKWVQDSDVFVIVTDTESRWLFIELWVAIERNLQAGKPKIYSIWKNKDMSIFYFHPSMKIVENIEKVLEDLEN